MSTSEMRIPLSSPDVNEADIEAVVSVLRTPRLSLGPKMEEFESAIAAYAGVAHGVAVSSGTAGLHLALLALGIGEGDEVIIPSFTFLAVANSILYVGARPVFVDIDPITWNVDAAKLHDAVTERTKAIIVVHTFGHPAPMDSIVAIARHYGLSVVEDACEAIGAEYNGKRVGSFSDIAVFSFYPNKPITTGEGGVVVTGDADAAAMMRALRNQGRRPGDDWLGQELLGYNYRLSEINCALGLGQMKHVDEILEHREQVARWYSKHLAGPPVVMPPLDVAGGKKCWFVMVVQLSQQYSREDRDRVVVEMAARGIGCSRYFAPLHLQPLYAPFAPASGTLSVTEFVAARTLALPFYTRLPEELVIEVCENLRQLLSV